MNTVKTVRNASDDPALAAVALTVTGLDHVDPTIPTYKLLPDTTTSKLVLSRPHW